MSGRYVGRERLQSTGAHSIIEILESKNKPLIANTILTANNHSSGQIKVHCAMAYAIDVDAYIGDLKRSDPAENITFNLCPDLENKLSYRDLLSTTGTCTFVLDTKRINTPNGFFIKLNGPNYIFEMGIENNVVYLQRNTYKVEYQINSVAPQGQPVFCCAIWTPEELKTVVLPIQQQSQITPEKWRKVTTKTCVIPGCFFDWARRKSLEPAKHFSTKDEFFISVIDALQSIEKKVEKDNMTNAFWNISYKGNKIVDRSPKKETDVQPILSALVSDIAFLKNIQIYREPQVGSGALDFAFIGALRSGGHAKVCVEVKNAHSKDLTHGLASQLPHYMNNETCDFGIYCVLNYSGKHFNEPSRETLRRIHTGLDAPEGVNIKVIVLNLSKTQSPSKTS